MRMAEVEDMAELVEKQLASKILKMTLEELRAFDVGIGLLAVLVVVISPLDAEATRIEYYATMGEPPCNLNYARSGLGYCDVLPSTGVEAPYAGVEAPYGELINVSIMIFEWL